MIPLRLRRPARGIWLAVAVGAGLLYVPGALAFYWARLANPFYGSSFAFGWKDPAELALAFGQLGLSPSWYASLTIARQVVIGLGCLALGTLIARRTAAYGALLIAGLLVITGTIVAVNTAALGDLGGLWALLGKALNVLSSMSVFTLVYVFPDGQFAPRWFRWVWLITAVVDGLVTFARGPALDALLAGWWPAQLLVWLFIAGQLVTVVLSPVYRYVRVAGPVQRQQLKWALLALVAQSVLWPIGAFGVPALFPDLTHSLASALAYNLLRETVQDLAFLLVPATIGLAILRYRLWDIDVLIRRTLVYAVLTALLALAYFGSVVVLQNTVGTLTGQRESTLVTVLSTLVIAALFVPLRRRVQFIIDRRFYRRKYDAARTLATFGAALRDETNLDRLTTHLLSVVDETMQPEGVTVWLRSAK